jgi:hypothetical protein
MKITILISGFILLQSYLLLSQTITPTKDFEFTMSNPYEIVDGTFSLVDGVKNYWSKNEEVLSVKFNDDGYVVFQKFSGNQLNETKRYSAERNKEIIAEAFEELDGRFYFFYVKKNNTAIRQMYVREIDFENCNWVGEEKLLFDIRTELAYRLYSEMFNSRSLSLDFNFVKSFDNKTLVIQYRLIYSGSKPTKQPIAFQMHSFNAELDELWSKEIVLPMSEEELRIFSATTDNNGNTYLLVEAQKKEGFEVTNVLGTIYIKPIELFKIDANDQTLSTFTIDLGENYISQIGLFAGKNGNLVAGGYYKNKTSQNEYGIFMYSTVEQGKESELVFLSLPNDVLLNNIAEKQQESIKDKKHVGLLIGDVLPREIIFEKDNSFTFIGESYKSISTDQGKTLHSFKEIIVSRFDPKGELIWTTKLPKNQISNIKNGGSGYTRIAMEEFEYYLVVDNAKNLNLTQSEVPAIHSDGAGGFLSGFKVNRETGEYTRFTIMDFRNVNGTALNRLILSKITYLSKSEFALEFNTKEKQNVIIKVSLTD